MCSVSKLELYVKRIGTKIKTIPKKAKQKDNDSGNSSHRMIIKSLLIEDSLEATPDAVVSVFNYDGFIGILDLE